MGRKSKIIQKPSHGIPWHQRPSSAPGGPGVNRAITMSSWELRAGSVAVEVSAPDPITIDITRSSWELHAGEVGVVNLPPGGVAIPLALSTWELVAAGPGVELGEPADVEIPVTLSTWELHAGAEGLIVAEPMCCGRIVSVPANCRNSRIPCCV